VNDVEDERPWERARAEGWEGVIAKRRGSPYEHRRSPHWLKMKCEATQELVVGGFTDPQGGRVGLGALLVGYYEGDDLVFAGSTSINPGTRLVGTPSYPGIAEDFSRAFEVLESLKPDVFLGAHTGFFGMEEKRARLGRPGTENPFVDPEGYRAHVAEKKRAFDAELARQRAARPAAP
jgi:hypothetical protein